MRSIRLRLCALLLTTSAIGSIGCYNGDVLSAGSKVLGGQLYALSADEILALNKAAVDLVSQVTGVPATPLTTPQAVTLANLLSLNSVNTLEDLESLIQRAQSDPESVAGLQELMEAFAGTEYADNPDAFGPDQIGTLFGALFGSPQTALGG